MRKIVSIILIVVGICICITPFVGRLYVKYEQDKMYAKYLEQLEKQNEQMDSAFNDQTQDAKEEPKGFDLSKVKGVIGLVEIPKIDCVQVLIEGSDGYSLLYGVGHVIGTAFPGEAGNVAIAGHRNGTFGTYFYRIDELQKGDEINCEYKGQSYVYKVTETFIVEPTDVSVLEGNRNQHILTLISCHPRGKMTHRIIVRAKLEQ